MVDSSRTTRYYYNNNWQVLTEIDGGGTLKAWYAYGNYIDEVLMTGVLTVPMFTRYYVHDHLYSPAVLVSYTGWVFERYEYDAYGSPYILEPNFAAEADGKSDYGNPYLFTGRRVDFLDNGRLTLQYNRHRYYDYYTGRWTTQDPLGIGGASPWRRRLSPPRGAAGKPAKSAKRRGGQAARRASGGQVRQIRQTTWRTSSEAGKRRTSPPNRRRTSSEVWVPHPRSGRGQASGE